MSVFKTRPKIHVRVPSEIRPGAPVQGTARLACRRPVEVEAVDAYPRRMDDAELLVDLRDGGGSKARLHRFATTARGLGETLEALRRDLPPPPALASALGEWRALAERLGVRSRPRGCASRWTSAARGSRCGSRSTPTASRRRPGSASRRRAPWTRSTASPSARATPMPRRASRRVSTARPRRS